MEACFTIYASNPSVKFTLYSLVRDKKGNCSLKEIQTATTTAKNRKTDEDDYEYKVTTDAILLGQNREVNDGENYRFGEYYISVESDEAAKGTATDYAITLNEEKSTVFDFGYVDFDFYTEGWTGEENGFSGTFLLESAALLSFDVYSDLAAKFSISTMVQDSKGKWSLKAIQTSSLKKNKNAAAWNDFYDEPMKDFTVTSNQLLLGPGEYFYTVESSKKGLNVSYEVALNENSDFFDMQDLSSGGTMEEGTFVHYGSFYLDYAANLSFWVSATNSPVKFTVFTITQDGSGKTSSKNLISCTVKKYTEMNREDDFYDDWDYDFCQATDKVLMTAGIYYYSIESTNKKSLTEIDYYFTPTEDSVFFDNEGSDNWDDDWRYLSSNEYESIWAASLLYETDFSGWVGFGDSIDYREIHLYTAGNLNFTIYSTDVVKFTVYSVDQKTGTSLKALTSVTTSKTSTPVFRDDEWGFEDEVEYTYAATTKSILLDLNTTYEEDPYGSYYISVESTNAAKGGSADYSLFLSPNSVFFDSEGSNTEDNEWKNLGGDCEFSDMYRDDSYVYDWVGFGDAIDYRRVYLEYAANLSFTINSTDTVKFTLYTVDPKNRTKLKSLQSVTTSTKNAPPRGEDDEYDDEINYTQSATTSPVLLDLNRSDEEDGRYGLYYISVESTNAAKGGSAAYEVHFSGNSVFFDRGYNGDDWTDLKRNGANSEEYNELGTLDISGGELIYDEWVGFGDAVDYYMFTLDESAAVSFTIDAGDAVKFSICELNGSKGNYSLKSLQATTLKKNKAPAYLDEDEVFWNYSATTSALSLTAGKKYFISVESTNAAKGGNADYMVTLNESSGNGGSNGGGSGGSSSTTITLNADSLYAEDPYYLDAYDDFWLEDSAEAGSPGYYRILLESPAKLSFGIMADNALKFSICQYAGEGKNGSSTWTVLQTFNGKLSNGAVEYYLTTKEILLEAGTYLLAVESTNNNSSYYTIELSDNSVFFYDGDDGSNNWLCDSKTKTINREVDEFCYTNINYYTQYIWLDYNGTSQDEWYNFVGFGDSVDFGKIEVDTCTLSFSINATDAATFTLYALTRDSKGTYSMKSLQSTTLSKSDGMYRATTKAFSLSAGTYYVSMESTNAAKGGSAYYNVKLESYATSNTSALDMPESSDIGDELACDADSAAAMQDSLSFGGYAGETDMLASGSAFAFADQDNGSDWLAAAKLA